MAAPAGNAWRLALVFYQPMWVSIVGPPAMFLIPLFPDGQLPSPRWRWFAWVLGISMVITFLSILFGPGRFKESAFPNVVNLLGGEALRPCWRSPRPPSSCCRSA